MVAAVLASTKTTTVFDLGGPTSLQAAPVQWKVEDGGNGHWYEAFSAVGFSWNKAAAAANAKGGYLATILSAAENDFVFSLVDAPEFWTENTVAFGPWLGGFQPEGADEPDGGWTWVTGETFVFDESDWNVGEPSNTPMGETTENAIHFDPRPFNDGEVGGWNDANDGIWLFPGYVVEYACDDVEDDDDDDEEEDDEEDD